MKTITHHILNTIEEAFEREESSLDEGQLRIIRSSDKNTIRLALYPLLLRRRRTVPWEVRMVGRQF